MSPSYRSRHSNAGVRETAAPPGLLLSSQSRRWHGVVVELHQFCEVDVVIPVREHIIGVHLAGTVSLLQARGGRTVVRRVRSGDATISPHGEPKRFQHAGENLVLLLRVAPTFVQEVAGDEYGLDPVRFELRESFGAQNPELVAIGKRLLAGLEAEGQPGRMQAEALAIELALHLLRHQSTAAIPERKAASRLSPRKLKRVLDYIDAHLRDDMALADLAGLLAMSPGHFARLFRQTTGLPPHRFVLERRVERAKVLLIETDVPITDIAQQVGCASHSHLSVLFHRETGVTPRDFRRHH